MKAMARMRVADVIVETLQAAGVQHCWGVPGDTLNYVTDAIRRSKIKFVHVRHEEAAAAVGARHLALSSLLAEEKDIRNANSCSKAIVGYPKQRRRESPPWTVTVRPTRKNHQSFSGLWNNLNELGI
jgi:hypothetical protein